MVDLKPTPYNTKPIRKMSVKNRLLYRHHNYYSRNECRFEARAVKRNALEMLKQDRPTFSYRLPQRNFWRFFVKMDGPGIVRQHPARWYNTGIPNHKRGIILFPYRAFRHLSLKPKSC
jgi:hypothetical protein